MTVPIESRCAFDFGMCHCANLLFFRIFFDPFLQIETINRLSRPQSNAKLQNCRNSQISVMSMVFAELVSLLSRLCEKRIGDVSKLLGRSRTYLRSHSNTIRKCKIERSTSSNSTREILDCFLLRINWGHGKCLV